MTPSLEDLDQQAGGALNVLECVLVRQKFREGGVRLAQTGLDLLDRHGYLWELTPNEWRLSRAASTQTEGAGGERRLISPVKSNRRSVVVACGGRQGQCKFQSAPCATAIAGMRRSKARTALAASSGPSSLHRPRAEPYLAAARRCRRYERRPNATTPPHRLRARRPLAAMCLHSSRRSPTVDAHRQLLMRIRPRATAPAGAGTVARVWPDRAAGGRCPWLAGAPR